MLLNKLAITGQIGLGEMLQSNIKDLDTTKLNSKLLITEELPRFHI